MDAIRIGIFDDHPIVSNGIKSYIENTNGHIQVEFCVSNKMDLFIELERTKIDVIIVDIVAPDVQGLDLFVELKEKYKDLNQLAYSTLKSPVLVENLLSINVKGFVNKSQEISELMEAINEVHNGHIYVPEKYRFLTSRFRSINNNSLTVREIEILKLMALEKTTTEIANELLISSKTVENHKQNLFKKMEVKNAAGLILTATRLGYIS
jgi:DNA-binding NarL/FixJ family response regulator